MTRLIDAEILFEKVGNIKPKNKSEYELLGKVMNMITNSPTVEIPHGEWIKEVLSMICKVNDYYGYTDSMHMFKVLFDQKYHGWSKESEAE